MTIAMNDDAENGVTMTGKFMWGCTMECSRARWPWWRRLPSTHSASCFRGAQVNDLRAAIRYLTGGAS